MPRAIRSEQGRTEPEFARPGGRRVAELRDRLREFGLGAESAERAVTGCLVWVSDLLSGIATLEDLRGVRRLMAEAAAAPGATPREGAPAAPLSGREWEVLQELRRDATLREIAESLFVSVNTVKSHVRAVYRKLGVCSREQAIHRAGELRLLAPPNAGPVVQMRRARGQIHPGEFRCPGPPHRPGPVHTRPESQERSPACAPR